MRRIAATFRSLPIKQKMMLIVTSTCALVLILASGVFLAVEIQAYRSELTRVLTIRSRIVGANSRAALVFNDPASALETLSTLSVDPHVMIARIYSKDGKPFASYRRHGETIPFPDQPGPDGPRLLKGRMEMTQGISFNGERIGSIFLAEDLELMYDILLFFLGTAFVVLLASTALALGLSSIFQRLVTNPLTELTRTVRAISERGDYSLRVPSREPDELGILIDGFNGMLDQIAAREADLRKALSLYAATIESTTDGILVVDRAGRFVSYNRRFVELWGIPEEIMSSGDDRRALEFVLSTLRSPDAFLARVRALYALPEEESSDIIEFKDGRIFERYSMPQRLEGQGIVGRVWSFRDVTERRRAEDDVRRLNAQLEERVRQRTAELQAAIKEMETFSYSVTHDLRAPLRSIDGFSAILAMKYGDTLDAQGNLYLERIRRSIRHMGEIIDDMLRLSRVNRAEMDLAPVDLSVLARRIVADLREKDPARKVLVEVLPGAKAWGDSGLLQLLLENLLGNSWKFTSKTPGARIEFKSFLLDGKPAFLVKDNGAGFDPKGADRLFKPFSRLHTMEEFEGTGIGLTIAARIVERHGGRIWAESSPGRGASFYFTLREGL